MEKRVERAIEIFLKAVDNETLAKGKCTACAVGNLVADGMGGTIDEYLECNKPNHFWGILFHTGKSEQRINTEFLNSPIVAENIKATEFTWQELSKIEYAFEKNTKISFHLYDKHKHSIILDDQIRGLEAVIEVMLSFSNDKTTDINKVFTKKARAL